MSGPPPASGQRVQIAVDRSFPGWEPFVPQFVHPLKVAIVEALLWIEEPLSAVQFGKLFRSAGQGFRESNVRYHLNHLAKAGVLEVISAAPSPGGGPWEKFFYFASYRTER